MELDKAAVNEMVEGIRQCLAGGLSPEQIRKCIMDAQQRSGLKKQQRRLVKVYNRHFEAALALARRMPAFEETCQLCGNTVRVCVTCSKCGRRICKDCSASVRYENRSGYTVLVPAITCKNCSGGDS